MKVISEHKCFDGVMGYYSHDSDEVGLLMRFAVYQPPQARTHKVPVLFYLAGLTCTEETFMIKAGAQRVAAETVLRWLLATPARAQPAFPERRMTGISVWVPDSMSMPRSRRGRNTNGCTVTSCTSCPR